MFYGELKEDDRLVYVNNVINGKLLESLVLVQQAANNTKEQFASSRDLSSELLNAIMDALAAHSTRSRQAPESERVRNGLRDILLGPEQLYEALRSRAALSKGKPSGGGCDVSRACLDSPQSAGAPDAEPRRVTTRRARHIVQSPGRA